MSEIRCLKTASLLLVAGVTSSMAGLLAQNGTPGVASGIEKSPQVARAYYGPVYVVKPGNFIANVIETGFLKADRSMDVYNLVEGETKIIRLAADGAGDEGR